MVKQDKIRRLANECGEFKMKIGVPKEIKNHEYRVGSRSRVCART